MVDRLRRKPGVDAVEVTIGDMTTTRVAGLFGLVCPVWNTVMNVTEQSEQVAVFANATAHPEPGGCFVVEVTASAISSTVPSRPMGSWARKASARGVVGDEPSDHSVSITPGQMALIRMPEAA